MGFLHQAGEPAKAATGAQPADTASQSALLNSVIRMIGGSAGLTPLLQKLNKGGLEEQVSSWIGSDQKNKPVSADQIRHALGEDTIEDVVQQTGLTPENAASGLARLLPEVIHQLTSYGLVPQGPMLQQGLDLLKDRLSGSAEQR